jgi:hypothetical protein
MSTGERIIWGASGLLSFIFPISLSALGRRPGRSREGEASRGAKAPSRKRLIKLSARRAPQSAWPARCAGWPALRGKRNPDRSCCRWRQRQAWDVRAASPQSPLPFAVTLVASRCDKPFARSPEKFRQQRVRLAPAHHQTGSAPIMIWFWAQLLGDVSDDVLDGPNVAFVIDGPNLIAFVIVDLWVAALVDDGAQFLRPLAGCLKRPHRTLANSHEALTDVDAVG